MRFPPRSCNVAPMSSLLQINTQFLQAVHAAKELTKTTAHPDGNDEDESFKATYKMLEKERDVAIRLSRKRSREEKGPSAKVLAVSNLELKKKNYTRLRKFDSAALAKSSLRKKYDDWVTSSSGGRGANKHLSYHGTEGGICFKVQTTDRAGTGVAWLYGAELNDEQPEFEEGDGVECTDDEGEEEAGAPRLAYMRIHDAYKRIQTHTNASSHTNAYVLASTCIRLALHSCTLAYRRIT